MELNERELNIVRQWFDATQDLLHPSHLERSEYVLARRIYEALSMRVPQSIEKNC